MIKANASGHGNGVASPPADMNDRVTNLTNALEKSLKRAEEAGG